MKLPRLIIHALFVELDLERKSCLTAVLWGSWVIAFDTLHSSPAYRYLVAAVSWLVGEQHAGWIWGLTMIAVGGLQLYGLFADLRRVRMGAAIFAVTMWLALALAFALYNPIGAAPVLYGLFAYSNAALYYQVGTYARVRAGRLLRSVPANNEEATR